MSRKANRYAGLNAAQKNDFLKLTPAEWKSYFEGASQRTLRKTYDQLCHRSGSEWERVKALFVEALIAKQSEVVSGHGQEINQRSN